MLEEIKKHYEKEFGNFTDLENDWDGYGSKGFSKKQLEFAYEFIAKLKSLFEKHNLTFIYPEIAFGNIGDSDMGLEWSTNKFNIDLDIYEKTNTITILAWTKDYNHQYHKKNIPMNQIDEEFIYWLKKAMK